MPPSFAGRGQQVGYGYPVGERPSRSLIVAATVAILLLTGGGVAAQTSLPADATSQAVVAQAEADVAAGRYGRAIERYRQLLKVTADDAAAFDLALRLAELANAVGRPDLSYDALIPRMKAPADRTRPPSSSRADTSCLTEAAGMLGRRNDAVDYARKLAAARLHRLGEDAPATLAAQPDAVGRPRAGRRGGGGPRASAGRARPSRTGRPGPLCPPSLNNTAIVLQNSGKLDSAAEMFGRLLQALVAGPESVELGITQFNAGRPRPGPAAVSIRRSSITSGRSRSWSGWKARFRRRRSRPWAASARPTTSPGARPPRCRSCATRMTAPCRRWATTTIR